MKLNAEDIEKALLAALQNSELSQEKIDDIIFHMTDWLDDLNNWSRFCANPNDLSSDEVHSLLIEFLVHVPAHLAAAAKLVTDLPVSDVFGIGATSEEKT